MTDIDFRKSEYGKEPREFLKPALYDPRNPSDRSLNTEHLTHLLWNVRSSCPTSGIFQFWSTYSHPTEEAVHVPEEAATLPSLSAEEEASSLIFHTPVEPSLPRDRTQFAEHCCLHAKRQKVSPEVAYRVERATRGQAKSALWCSLHKGRITSSRFHDVFVRRPTTSPDNLVISLMGYKSVSTINHPALLWGTSHETVARMDYVTVMHRLGHQVVVKESGLTLLADKSYLGASSDGRVYDPNCSLPSGVLEIKCPYSIDGTSITTERVSDIARTHGSKFFLEFTNDGQLTLKKSSRHYCQVQGEMAIMKVRWCDFVVWTTADMHIERIYFNQNFWEDSLLPKLESFYVNSVVPEILTGTLYNQL